MTEAEWLNCSDHVALVTHLRGTATPRKLRLFAVATARHIESQIRGTRYAEAIDVAEAFAEALPDGAELERQFRDVESMYYQSSTLSRGERYQDVIWSAICCLDPDPRSAASLVPSHVCRAVPPLNPFTSRSAAELLRDIFGNPFRPVTLDPAWRTDAAVALARGIYEDRAFDHMPILADALQDAGCDKADVLNHCRGPGPHVRGCWVIDLVLGKE